MSSKFLRSGLFLLVFGQPAAVFGQTYNANRSSGFFSSISSIGTQLTLANSDDGDASLSVPFSFQFFGQTISTFDTLYVSSNGTVSVNTPYSSYSNTTIPTAGTPDGFIAPFWDDLRFNSGGLYYYVSGTTGSRTLTIEWSGVSSYNATSDTISFQVVIYEGNDLIEVIFGPRSVTTPSSWEGTVGIENMTGTQGAQDICTPYCTPTDLPDGAIVTFSPDIHINGVDLSVDYVSTIPATIPEGTTEILDFDIYNGGSSVSPASTVSLFAGVNPTVTANDYELASTTISGINPGGYATDSMSVTIPTGFAGTYYVAVIVDPFSGVSETNETNNTYPLGSITVTGGTGSAINITTTSLPAAQIGGTYSAQLTQTGAAAPFWYVSSGQLPPGLSLSSSGMITGTPTTNGTTNFSVTAEESGLTPDTANLSITVGSSGGLQITTTQLPMASVGVPYSGSIQVSGGQAPYTFQVLSGRPDWMFLDIDGNATGTPDATGSHTITIIVYDNLEAEGTGSVTLEVGNPLPLTVVETLVGGVTNREYSQQIASGGIPPYNVSVTSDAPPPGLAIIDGYLTGVPTQDGTFSFGVSITDAEGTSAQGTVIVEIALLTELSVQVGAEVVVFIRSDVNQQLQATGGVPPYTWNLSAGVLLPGLSLDSSGLLTGRVEEISDTPISLMVTDAEGSVAIADTTLAAKFFRPSTQGTTGSRRSKGCVCVTEEASAGSLLSLLFVGLLLALRVDRRRAA